MLELEPESLEVENTIKEKRKELLTMPRLESVLNFFKLDSDEDDFDDYDDYSYNEPEEQPRPVRKAQPKPRPVSREVDEDSRPKSGFLNSRKVVSLNRSMSEIKLFQPTTFTDSEEICETLIEGKPVIVNLEDYDIDEGQRIMDFISGCIYAIDGNYHEISRSIYIFSPNGVNIVGGLLEDADDEPSIPTLSKDF